MSRRSLEIFGNFPTSDWNESFFSDAEGATRVRIASGFTNLRGACDLVELLSPSTTVDFLLGLNGCEGPDVVRQLEKHPLINVRGSRVPEFHWKAASVEASSGRLLYIGSANFTRKGLQGAGEIMVRLAGRILDTSVWDSFQESFDAFFAEGATLRGNALLNVLERVDARGDAARGAQADLEDEIKCSLDEINAQEALNGRPAWFILWDANFTSAETKIIDRVLGACPSESWTRGQFPENVVKRVRVGDAALGYDRDEASFVLGRIGRLELVDLGRGRSVWVTDLNHLANNVDGRDHAEVYASIRKILGTMVLGNGGILLPPQYLSIIAVLRSAGLFQRRM